LSREEKNKLGSYLYHDTHSIYGTYDVKKNKTVLIFKRGNAIMYENLKKYIGGGNYTKFSYNVVIDYKNKNILTRYPNTSYNKSFSTEVKQITFNNENKTLGTYKVNTQNGVLVNVIDLDKNISNKITPNVVFANTNFGVDKIESIYNTIKLITVSYEK
jgi:hypothetical protein